jgi:hypothetical protein
MESGMDFFTSLFPCFHGVGRPSPRRALRRMARSNAQTVGRTEGVYKLYALMLNEF